MTRSTWLPTVWPERPWVQPATTPLSGKVEGSPRSHDESNCSPSSFQPV
ncbi:Uncharacterised protein [Mycobacteroides abscessus]|nr:Uncharacterised protein [Mycobacteroides abscessus]